MTRRRSVLVALALVAGAAALWALTGGIERLVRERIEAALIEERMPAPLAACMADRLAARLSIAQLRELQRLRPPGGERGALALVELVERARRIDDPEVVEVLGTSAAVCAFVGAPFLEGGPPPVG